MNPLSLALAACVATAPLAPTEGLRSYSRARNALDAGVRAIGGVDALRAVKTVRRRLTGGWTDTGQGRRPYPVTPPSLAIPPAHFQDDLLSFIDYGRSRWYEAVESSNRSGDRVVQVDAVDEDAGFQTLTYFDEKPLHRRFAEAELRSLRVQKLRRYPEGLLRMALDRPETLGWVGSVEIDELGGRHDVVSFADPAGTRVLLYLDARTGLLGKSEVLRAHPVAGDSYAEVLYFDHRPAGALRLPHRYVDRVAGLPTQEMRVTAIDLDAPAEDVRWRPPPAVAEVEADPAEPVVERLGRDVYLIRGPYNSVFADLGDGVVVLEAARSSRYSEQCLRLIRSTLPARPIRWVVSTHFHHDHVAGVRPYVAAGATILTTPDAEGTVQRVVASRPTMHPDATWPATRAAVVETVSTTRVLGEGSRRLELHDFGPTEHVAQMLVAYFPQEKLLFQADLFDVTSKELVLAGPDTVRMAERIRELGLDVERIVPVHGLPTTADALERALAVRARHVR